MTEDPSRAVWLQQARSYLRNADPVLARLIDERPDFDPRAWMAQLPPMDLFGALLFQVTGQQLSVPATRRTLARIQALFGGHLPAPAELLGVDPGQLREAGLSWRKIGTLRDLAERLADGRLNQDVLSSLPDDELMAELTAIPGIGPWTVQGALLIALQREDVVLPGDLALRKAIQAAYQLDHLPASRRSWRSPRSGGPTAAWRPATCSPPPSSQPRHHRSPGPGAPDGGQASSLFVPPSPFSTPGRARMQIRKEQIGIGRPAGGSRPPLSADDEPRRPGLVGPRPALGAPLWRDGSASSTRVVTTGPCNSVST